MKNKIGKYFKYAIGEILLVVIGILIALQINTWNENQKKVDLKNEYITSLINDFTKDSLQINPRMLRNKLRIEHLNSLIDSVTNGHFDNLDKFIELFYNTSAGIRVTNVYNTNSFNLLISSGNIDLFDKTLRTELMELNRLQSFERTIQESNGDYLLEYLENLGLKYPGVFGVGYNTTKTSQLLWANANIKDLPRDLMNSLSQEQYTISRYLELTEHVIQQTNLVLKLLHQE